MYVEIVSGCELYVTWVSRDPNHPWTKFDFTHTYQLDVVEHCGIGTKDDQPTRCQDCHVQPRQAVTADSHDRHFIMLRIQYDFECDPISPVARISKPCQA